MMNRILASVMVSAIPLLALAQGTSPGIYYSPYGLRGLITWASQILNMILPLIIAIAVVWFVYNIFRYAVAGNEEEKAQTKTQIVWGVVGLFVMVSVWGLVAILASTFNLNNTLISAPKIQIPGN